MMLGLDHIGVGVADLEASRRFYGDLGLDEVAFDYTGPLPGLEPVAGRAIERARVVMLRPSRPTPLGPSGVKLVQVLDAPVPPLPEGLAWGEPGVCEVCVHVRDHDAAYRRLVEERGHVSLMEPVGAVLDPHGTAVRLSYLADPDGGKVELIEWPELEAGWPTPAGPQGVNHVAFGVADIERSAAFYRRLGFTGTLFESDGYFEPMHPWYPGEPPRQRMMLLTNPFGAGLEPVQHTPPSPDMRGEWGHAGPFELAVGVRNAEQAVARLGEQGVAFRGGVQTVSVETGEWRYAYLDDPDGLYVSLVEARY
jgi:catechol 2,3-dioxygenase-like lactoylglutathione lyase family enzyme